MTADIVCPIVRADVTCYWKDMWRRLDAMRRLWQLCDVRLRTDDGSSFMAHSPVLAASSDVLHHMLVAARHETFIDGTGIVPVRNVTPDVLRITLDFIYGVTPTSRADFERLRIGAAQLGIEGAYEYCCRRLGENASAYQQTAASTIASAVPAAIATESSAVLEASCTPAIESQSEETLSVDCSKKTLPDVSEVQELVVDGASVVHHAEMMAHMSLVDLARSDECPHLRRLASEVASAAVVGDDESSGSVDDVPGLIDLVPLKKRVRSSELRHSQARCEADEASTLYKTATANSETALGTDTGNSTAEMSAFDVSSVVQTDGAMSSNLEAPRQQCPQTMLSANMSCNTLLMSATNSSDCATLRSPAVCTMSLLASEVDACISYMNGACSVTAFSSQADQPLGTAVTTSSLLSTSECVQPPFDDGPFSSVSANSITTNSDSLRFNSANVMAQDAYTVCVPGVNYRALSADSHQWPNVAGASHASSIPSASDLVCFSHSSVASSVPQFVPPATPSLSSVATAPASAGHTAADLSYISLDDVSAVLKANGFSDKALSQSGRVCEMLPESNRDSSETHASRASRSLSTCASDLSQGVTTSIRRKSMSVARVCIFCHKRCKSERQLINHLRSDHCDADGSKPCALCSESFGKVMDLACHLQDRHNYEVDNDFALSLARLNGNACYFERCMYKNPHADALKRHLFQKHGVGQPTLQCPSCNHTSFSEGQLNRHVSRVHSSQLSLPDSDDASNGSTGSAVNVSSLSQPQSSRVASVQCGDCGQVLDTIYKLQIHQLRAHNKGKLFSCHHCSFKSPRKKDVQAHMLSQHGTAPPGVKVYSCVLCNYKCIDKNRFEEHDAMHTGILRFRCSLCPRVYTTRRGLRTHIKYHSTDRPHCCSLCNASFKVRSKLADHVKLVHVQKGLKPYECGYCGHQTALRGNCNQHVRKSHPGMPIIVVDQLATQRRSVKDYDYAGFAGANIQQHSDLHAAGWNDAQQNTLVQ